MSRSLKTIRDAYAKNVTAFVEAGLALPPEVVELGRLPAAEVVAQLVTLHQDCVRRASTSVPGYAGKAAQLGQDLVTATLLGDLADRYGLAVAGLEEGIALRGNPDALYDRAAQPRRPGGELDHSVLGPECEAEFARNGWAERQGTVDAYATPFDPRLALIRSRIGLRVDGIAWVSYFRPQNFQVARFDDLGAIHHQSNQWCLDFGDWRRRRLADPGGSAPWDDLVVQLRALSTRAGLAWEQPEAGRRTLAGETVVYDLAEWTDGQRSALTERLMAADVPHLWAGSDLTVPQRLEAVADAIISP